MIDTGLSPPVAVAIFIITVLAGYQYRRVWKADGSRTGLWVWGSVAFLGFAILGLVPLSA
ncbi:MAG: hypothetical protein AAF465_04950 [Pseudomonadota bacterium]